MVFGDVIKEFCWWLKIGFIYKMLFHKSSHLFELTYFLIFYVSGEFLLSQSKTFHGVAIFIQFFICDIQKLIQNIRNKSRGVDGSH